MNLLVPMTPATTGPLCIPIRIRRAVPRSALSSRIAASMRSAMSAIDLGVVGAGDGQPRGRHVGVADRLDLLDAEPARQGVEAGDQVVEQRDERRGSASPRAA